MLDLIAPTLSAAQALPYPDIDPIALQLGPIAIRWYSLAYIVGVLAGWRLILRFARDPNYPLTEAHANDFPTWAIIGIMGGARLGYVLFYKPAHYLSNPSEILAVWEGGMSFHGGLVGMALAIYFFARSRKLPLGVVTDSVSCVAPVGLFCGRMANFVNGELWGRTTDSPLGMVFPRAGDEPRHPSQLYEGILEGIVLFTVLNVLRRPAIKRHRPGFVSGLFLIGYGLARSTAELFRQPDAHLGFIVSGITMGQILSIPMILIGIYVVMKSWPAPDPVAQSAAPQTTEEAKEEASPEGESVEAPDAES